MGRLLFDFHLLLAYDTARVYFGYAISTSISNEKDVWKCRYICG